MDAPANPASLAPRETIYRHALPVRLSHWATALCIFILLMSGMQIFNAHPALYWGEVSTFDHPLFVPGSFPRWLTLPAGQDLATGRLWHFLAAWGLVASLAVYYGYGLLSGHLRRDLVPAVSELGEIPHDVAEHAHLRFAKGEAAKRYNVLQKLTYLAVVLVLFPTVVLAGLAMSPGMDAAYPVLLDLFGGRQSARTLHFAAAAAIALFVAVHLAMVLVSGFFNNLRSMITGVYAIEPEGDSHVR